MKYLLIFLLLSVGLNAQFNYQAIVKHSSGGVISNNQVKIKFSLMYQSSNATPTFIEEHEITVPDDGVVNLSVGGGTIVNGTFSDIDWSNSVFIKEELDIGSGYQDMGTRQVASVPVAEFAKSISGFESDDFFNIKIGDGALSSHTIGSTNIAIGQSALSSNTTGVANVAIGHMSLSSNVSGVSNVGIGYSSLLNNRANENVGIGNSSLGSNVSGKENVAVGSSSLFSNKADGNTAVGYLSMNSNQTGYHNTALGWNTLTSNDSGKENTSIGAHSMAANTTGYANTAVGRVALHWNLDGNHNSAVGQGALFANTSGSENTAIGDSALQNVEEGYNVGVGRAAGIGIVSGTLNTAIGYRSNISNNLTNATAIGAIATVTASNTIQLGNTDVTLVNTSAAISANDYLVNGGESLVDIVSQLPSSDDYAALTSDYAALSVEVAEIDIQTDSLSSTQSDIASLIASIEALNVAQSALLASVDELIQSNKSEIKSAQVGINSNDVVLFELGVLRFSWNNTYNTIQVKQSSSSEIVDNWYISGIIRSDTETYIQKSNMTYGLGDDGGYNDRFTPIWSNGFTSLMDGSIALGSAYSNFEFYITPMGSGSTPYDPVPTWQLRGHVDGYNQLTVTCIHAKFDGTSGW
jgi:hypothetical protein